MRPPRGTIRSSACFLEACPAKGDSIASLKGTDFVSIRNIAKRMDLYDELLRSLHPEDRERMAHILPLDWVPLESASRVFSAAAKLIYKDDPRAVWLLAQECARDHINGLLKFFLPLISSPAQIIKRAAMLWETFYDRGQGSVVEGGVDDKFAVFMVRGNPALTPVNREFIAGWSAALIEMTGMRNVTVQKGESDPNAWTWRFSWL